MDHQPSAHKPIALLVTAYNRQVKLERMLASVASELALIDIIIVDDGSTPPLDLSAYSHYPLHVIRLEYNHGTMAAANAGLRYILEHPYAFIARLDSDDMAAPDRFTKQLAYMREHADVVLLGSAFDIVNEDGDITAESFRVLDDKSIRNYMHIDCMLHHTTWMLRADAVRECGFYNECYKASGDFEYAWRMVQCGKVANLPDKLVRYEAGAKDALSGSRRSLQAYNALIIKLRNFNFFSQFSYLGLVYSGLDLLHLRAIINCTKRCLFKA